MRKRIYAFYKPTLLDDQNEHFAQANIWKSSWEHAGWECVMLNQSHASHYFSFIMGKILAHARNHPIAPGTVGAHLIARFGRWSALLGVNGGWMSDYDVVNLGFTPEMADKIEQQTTLAVNAGSPAWIFYTTPSECLEACKDFVERDMFKKSKPEQAETEAKILGVKKDFFKGIKTLVHVTGEDKSQKMKDLFVKYIRPETKDAEEEKFRNRK
jgi:hypothetical protein